MQKLPFGESDFAKIRFEKRIYVDKTELIYHLVTENSYYFLSRPRRFGKSLLVSTLKYLFQGRADLFAGLWLAEQSDWTWQSYPIIIFDFNLIAHDTPENLQYGLNFALDQMAQEYQITFTSTAFETKFQELIVALHAKTAQPVVILVDEYDKPLIEHLGKGAERLQIGYNNRDILRQLFGILKGATVTPVLRFMLLTGVSRFSRVSIFSELNQLYDISMVSKYADLLGYTQAELEHYFQPHLTALATELNISQEELRELLTYYYNGYRFSNKDVKMYNPFSILGILTAQEVKGYWFETGTPTFLVNLLKAQQVDLANLEALEVNPMSFNTFDLDNLDIPALLFQTGYLTIKTTTRDIYTLGYPNYEVKQAFNEMLFKAWAMPAQISLNSAMLKLNRFLLEEKLPQFFETMQALFAAIPYDIQVKQIEGYYHTVFYLMLAASGSQARSSVLTSQGRIDLAVFFKTKMYIFEFKCNQAAQVAIDQIKQQGYALPYRGEYQKITLIGINFNSEKRNLVEWQVEIDTP